MNGMRAAGYLALTAVLVSGCAGDGGESGASVESPGELAGRVMGMANANYRGPRSWDDVFWADYGDATDEYDYFTAGEKAYGAGHYKEAARYFSKAIAVAPRARQYSYRGWSYAQLGRLREAEQDARKAIELERNSPLGYFDLGSFKAMQGQGEAACAELTRALERGLNPQVLSDDPDLSKNLEGEPCFEKLRRRD